MKAPRNELLAKTGLPKNFKRKGSWEHLRSLKHVDCGSREAFLRVRVPYHPEVRSLGLPSPNESPVPQPSARDQRSLHWMDLPEAAGAGSDGRVWAAGNLDALQCRRRPSPAADRRSVSALGSRKGAVFRIHPGTRGPALPSAPELLILQSFSPHVRGKRGFSGSCRCGLF